MRQILFSTIVLLITIATSCKNGKTSKESIDSSAKNSNQDTTTFFNTKGFFINEIKDVKETPYFMYTTIITNGKRTDSFPLIFDQFAVLAQQFVDIDITNPTLKHFYQENVYRDLTTKTINFNYKTTNKQLEVQNIDVLIEEETNKVVYIFIRTLKNYPDSAVSKQLNWNKDKSFLINKSVSKLDGSRISTQQWVNWNE